MKNSSKLYITQRELNESKLSCWQCYWSCAGLLAFLFTQYNTRLIFWFYSFRCCWCSYFCIRIGNCTILHTVTWQKGAQSKTRVVLRLVWRQTSQTIGGAPALKTLSKMSTRRQCFKTFVSISESAFVSEWMCSRFPHTRAKRLHLWRRVPLKRCVVTL